MADAVYPGASEAIGGSTSPARLLDLNATGQVIKAGPGRLYGYHLSNSGSAIAFVKLYNQATAPTADDTPVLVLGVTAGATVAVNLDPGCGFDVGISARATTGVADDDDTGPGTDELTASFTFN